MYLLNLRLVPGNSCTLRSGRTVKYPNYKEPKINFPRTKITKTKKTSKESHPKESKQHRNDDKELSLDNKLHCPINNWLKSIFN